MLLRHAPSVRPDMRMPDRAWMPAAARLQPASTRLASSGAARRRSPPCPPPPASIRLVQPSEDDMRIPYQNVEDEAAFQAALSDPELCAEVLAQAKAAGKAGATVTSARWVPGAAFVPQPWSPASPRGVPLAWDGLAQRADHVVIQVPPPVTYKCRVPGRVVAIYELVVEG